MVIPCVCYHIEEKDLYEIVDSYHRYMVMKTSQRIYDREKGLLPVVVINKDTERDRNRLEEHQRKGRSRRDLVAGSGTLSEEPQRRFERYSCNY